MEIITSERIPLYVFAEVAKIEPDCLQQAKNTANMGPAYHHVALMPDAHIGYGMPIGGVIALEGVICPNAVGVDIGCGMGFVPTDLEADSVSRENLEKLVHQVRRDIPTGFNIHKKAQSGSEFLKNHKLPAGQFTKEVARARKSLGTLGGGNHFIDFHRDQDGHFTIMVHSGSRHFGFAIANYYHRKAQDQCAKRGTPLPDRDLAYLGIETAAGKEYIYAMNLAMGFAHRNRERLLEVAKHWVAKFLGPVEFGEPLNAHHNYAALEEHFGKEVWVHRKGAIRAEKGEPVIVPGSSGTHSYVGVGLGNPDSFNSCAHGAGRVMGRKEAKRRFTPQEVLADLEKRGVLMAPAKRGDVPEESPLAYKDIEEVIKHQAELAEMTLQLTPLAAIIG